MSADSPLARTLARVYPFEWVAYLNFMLTVTFLRYNAVGVSLSTVESSLLSTIPFYVGYFLAAIGARWVLFRLQRTPIQWKELFTGTSLLFIARCIVASAVVSYSYVWLKLTIPLTRQVVYDDLLWMLDRKLHLGVDLVLTMPSILSYYKLLPLIDLYYGFFFLHSILLALGWFSTASKLSDRKRFALGYCLVWILGAWLYLAVPSLGPCYVGQKLLIDYAPQIPASVKSQGNLWQNYQKVSEAKVTGRIRAPFEPIYGVAAFPSLHVGAHAFFACWFIRRNRRWLLVWLGITELTFLGSIATGWHYAIDGYAGALLALLCWVVARLVHPDPQAEPPPPNQELQSAEE